MGILEKILENQQEIILRLRRLEGKHLIEGSIDWAEDALDKGLYIKSLSGFVYKKDGGKIFYCQRGETNWIPADRELLGSVGTNYTVVEDLDKF